MSVGIEEGLVEHIGRKRSYPLGQKIVPLLPDTQPTLKNVK